MSIINNQQKYALKVQIIWTGFIELLNVQLLSTESQHNRGLHILVQICYMSVYDWTQTKPQYNCVLYIPAQEHSITRPDVLTC